MNYNNLPRHVKDNGLFCLWKYEQRGDSKPTKVPYQVSGIKAQPNNGSTFTSFNTALNAVSKFDGLGIGIFHGISAIDIDHCVDENGELSEMVQDIMDLFNGSYMEYSPSGAGLRILFLTSAFQYDKAKYYINNQGIGLEVYVSGATNKYVTVTGNVQNKLYQVRARGWEHDKEHFVCATYRKIKGVCSSHQIRNVVVEELLIDGIKQITAFATKHESEFVQMVTKKTQAELNRSLRDSKKELELAQARITKLDIIIQRLYEDNIEGKISDERFTKMSTNYEDEQNTLTSRIAELKTLITNENESSDNTDRFLSIVRKYTHITELTAALIREFVEKIYVYKTERIDGKKVQRIKIIWNCIGEFNMPPNAGNEKSA